MHAHGPERIFLWVGADAAAGEAAAEYGRSFLFEKGLDPNTKLTVVHSGEEDETFWRYFVNG